MIVYGRPSIVDADELIMLFMVASKEESEKSS
jgi:hypothetical protein